MQSRVLVPIGCIGSRDRTFILMLSRTGEEYWVYVPDVGDVLSVAGKRFVASKAGKPTLTREKIDKKKNIYSMKEIGILMGFDARSAQSKAYKIYRDSGLLTRIGRKWYMSRENLRRELWERLDEMGIV